MFRVQRWFRKKFSRQCFRPQLYWGALPLADPRSETPEFASDCRAMRRDCRAGGQVHSTGGRIWHHPDVTLQSGVRATASGTISLSLRPTMPPRWAAAAAATAASTQLRLNRCGVQIHQISVR